MRDSTVDSSYRLQLLTPTLTIWYAATDSNWCDKTKLADRHMITLAQRYRNAKRKHNGWHKEIWFASKIINLLCRLCYHFFASPKQVTKVDLKKNFKKKREEDNMLSNLPASSFSRQPSKPTSSLPPKSRSEFDDARPAPENPRSIVLSSCCEIRTFLDDLSPGSRAYSVQYALLIFFLFLSVFGNDVNSSTTLCDLSTAIRSRWLWVLIGACSFGASGTAELKRPKTYPW